MTNKENKNILIKEKEINGTKYKVYYNSVFDSNFKEEREWQYWKEKVYTAKVILPGSQEEKDIELIINKNDRALWKIVVDWQEYVIWKNSNDKWSWFSAKINDTYVTVYENTDKNWNAYYTIYFKEEIEEEEPDNMEEVEFDI